MHRFPPVAFLCFQSLAYAISRATKLNLRTWWTSSYVYTPPPRKDSRFTIQHPSRSYSRIGHFIWLTIELGDQPFELVHRRIRSNWGVCSFSGSVGWESRGTRTPTRELARGHTAMLTSYRGEVGRNSHFRVIKQRESFPSDRFSSCEPKAFSPKSNTCPSDILSCRPAAYQFTLVSLHVSTNNTTCVRHNGIVITNDKKKHDALLSFVEHSE